MSPTDKWVMNLQLFAGEKTEPATPKRRQEARKRGQVVRSHDLTSAAILLAVILFLRFYGHTLVTSLSEALVRYLGAFPTGDFSLSDVRAMVIDMLLVFIPLMFPILGVALVMALVSNVAQVGFLLTGQPLAFQLSRLNPVTGFQRIFSRRSAVEFLKSLGKLVIIGFIAYKILSGEVPRFPAMLNMDLDESVLYLGRLFFSLSLKISLALFLLAVLDYGYQRYDYEQQLRMSKEEIKEELKETEGNPQIKSKIREIQRKMAISRMMSEVPKADVVITNPTHIAVALQYDSNQHAAPLVVAKGQDYLAERIKKVAKEANVTIVENKPLARSLYQLVDIGEMIPEELYKAVAEILAFVYSLKNKA